MHRLLRGAGREEAEQGGTQAVTPSSGRFSTAGTGFFRLLAPPGDRPAGIPAGLSRRAAGRIAIWTEGGKTGISQATMERVRAHNGAYRKISL
jgi:hypothetical protein